MCSMEEGGVVTTCELTTYELDSESEGDSVDISFTPHTLTTKIIMKVPHPRTKSFPLTLE
jgi:hypothetical protein